MSHSIGITSPKPSNMEKLPSCFLVKISDSYIHIERIRLLGENLTLEKYLRNKIIFILDFSNQTIFISLYSSPFLIIKHLSVT